MDFGNFTPEQAEKARELGVAEMLKFAKEEGVELTDEQMDAVSGGGWGKEYDTEIECPACHKKILCNMSNGRPSRCGYCGEDWSSYS